MFDCVHFSLRCLDDCDIGEDLISKGKGLLLLLSYIDQEYQDQGQVAGQGKPSI